MVPEIRQTAYRELFRLHMDNDTLHEIRESLNHELVLGRSYFKDKIGEITARQTRLGVPWRPGLRGQSHLKEPFKEKPDQRALRTLRFH